MAHLLIVDDDPVVRRSLIRALAEHTCVAASNGLEALQWLEMCDFDLVITDVDMPVMDGLQFYRRLCANFPDVEILFHTGSSFAGQLDAPVLSKSWPMPKVIDEIEQRLGVETRDADLDAAGAPILEMGRG
jgi:CheY-like chemotaxis protein